MLVPIGPLNWSCITQVVGVNCTVHFKSSRICEAEIKLQHNSGTKSTRLRIKFSDKQMDPSFIAMKDFPLGRPTEQETL